MTAQKQGTILRFAVVGVGVAAIYLGLYLALLALDFRAPTANLLAFLVAVVIQYIGQTMWTFRRPLALPDQLGRFLFTITFGLLSSGLITGYLGPVLGWSNWISAAIVTVVLPVQNYLFFKAWVFAGKTELVERQ